MKKISTRQKLEDSLLKHMHAEIKLLERLLINFQEEQFAILKFDQIAIERLLAKRQDLVEKSHALRLKLVSDINRLAEINRENLFEELQNKPGAHGILATIGCKNPALIHSEDMLHKLAERIHRQSKRNAFLAEELCIKG